MVKIKMNFLPTVLSQAEYAELNSRPEYRKYGGTCPTCGGTGLFRYRGEEVECEKDFDGRCIQQKLFQRYELANIPMRYQRFNFLRDFGGQQQALEFVNEYTSHIDNAIRHGLGMYVYSSGLGTGKTAVATHILKQAVLRRVDGAEYSCWFDSFFNMLDTPKLLPLDREFREKKYLDTDILVIDDVVPGKISEKQEMYYSDILERTIRHRAHNSLSTIVTTNMEPSDLADSFGRVFSLLSDSCETIQLSSDVDSRIERGVGQLLRQSLHGEVSPIV